MITTLKRALASALVVCAAAAAAPAQVLYETSFDDAGGWTIAPQSSCRWDVDADMPGSNYHVPGGPYRSPPTSLNCNSSTGNGYTFCQDCTATSPPIALPGVRGGTATLSFWCSFALEDDDCIYDTRHVQISNDGFQNLLLDRCYLFADCDPFGWHEHTIPLDPAWGTIQVRFYFDIGDFLFANWAYDGWYVDDLTVEACGAVSAYCTAKPNSLGCLPSIFAAGMPSATQPVAFRIKAANVINNKKGILIYGYSPAALPFQGGTLCVSPPIRRTDAQDSQGNPPPLDCSGLYSFEFNDLIRSGKDAMLQPGQSVYTQYWSRDKQSPPAGTGLTDALTFVICP